MNKLSKLVSTHIAKIHNGDYSDQQLLKLYRNIDASEELAEVDREKLINAIEEHLRTMFPRSAKKLFGPKDAESREVLNRIWLKATDGVDLSGNKHNNGVKTGGAMLNGQKHVDVYISYKNDKNQAIHLNVVQDAPGHEYIATFARYTVGQDDVEESISRPVSDIDALGDRFASALKTLV